MFPKDLSIPELEAQATKIRRMIIQMLAEAGSGHPGGSLSSADIITCLFYNVMRHNPQNPDWKERDRFHMSKGHSCPLWYALLADCGYFPEEEIYTLRKFGSILQGHPDMKRTPGVNMSSGSLGQGLSVANGMALAARLDKKDYRVYVLLGDGECEEGQVWEASMAAAHYCIDNLCAVLDHNGLQIDGRCCDIMSPEPLPGKWKAFGWNVIEIDGHDYEQILEAFEAARSRKGQPSIIIADTIKGKGVPFMENQVDWHGKAPSEEQAQEALSYLEWMSGRPCGGHG